MALRSAGFAALPAVFFACWIAVRAQQQPAPPPGFMGDPQIITVFNRIAQQTARLMPMLAEVHARDWVAKGASETYIAQLQSAQTQVQAVQTDMAALAQHPDNMQDCMKGLFRVQALHGSLESLMGGLRRYQNSPLADLIESVAAEDQSDLEKLQSYILELANQKEQEFLVVDHEAQRCRATISREPAPAKSVRRTAPQQPQNQ
jgi:ABC-type transport system involved in cytochrome bd biosynthesis fused ATPase/permease subunit